MIKNSRLSYVVAILILLLAAALRLSEISTLPPGLHEQEIIDVRLAENARQGDIQVFYNVSGEGRDGLYPILLAAVTASIGGGTVGYHMLSAWIGLIVLALVYAAGKRLYGDFAGLAAMGLLAFSFFPVLLSRLVGREALLPLLVTAILLSASLALPIYWRKRDYRTQTTAFAALGLTLGLSFYVHPAGIVIAVVPVVIVVYLLVLRRKLTSQTISYLMFTFIVAAIIAVPYLTSAVRLPELSGSDRLIDGFLEASESPWSRLLSAVVGIGIRGDRSPIYNLPERPLFDPISALLIGVGLVVALRYVRKPRYGVVVIALVLLLPLALFTPNSPYFPAFASVLPVLALLFGLGVVAVSHYIVSRSAGLRSLVRYAVAALLLFNIAWTYVSLFEVWRDSAEAYAVYNGDVASLANYIDLTAGNVPTLVCASDITQNAPQQQLSAGRLLSLMLNRQDTLIRYADCSRGIVFINGGDVVEQIVRVDHNLASTDPFVLEWFEEATPVERPNLPEGAVLLQRSSNLLADKIGRFTTTAPVSYAPEASAGETVAIAPPVAFENNLTFLGYEPMPTSYAPGDLVPVVTYWRADGLLPPDLTLFAHIQDDPGSRPAANSDVLNVVPQRLRNRDVFMQVSYVQLPPSMAEREYIVSVGAYQRTSGTRLRVLPANGEGPRGDRLILYRITVDDEAARARNSGTQDGD